MNTDGNAVIPDLGSEECLKKVFIGLAWNIQGAEMDSS